VNKDVMNEATLREFLLGKLDDEERNHIETLFLTDETVREQILIVEQALIDDYLEEELAPEDVERFLARFAQTEEQRQKLRITKAIIDRARSSSSTQAGPVLTSTWSRLRRSYLKPIFVVPIAVVIVIACVLGIVWRNWSEEKRKHQAIEQELAQLNLPARMREVPAQLVTLELRPVAVRSIEPQAQLNVNTESRFVELHLSWIQKERSSTYLAEVRRVGSSEVFSFPLQVVSASDPTIRLRLPVHLLTRGNYLVRLISIAPDGTTGFSEEYSFAVRHN
jgi:hypothetical protein